MTDKKDDTVSTNKEALAAIPLTPQLSIKWLAKIIAAIPACPVQRTSGADSKYSRRVRCLKIFHSLLTERRLYERKSQLKEKKENDSPHKTVNLVANSKRDEEYVFYPLLETQAQYGNTDCTWDDIWAWFDLFAGTGEGMEEAFISASEALVIIGKTNPAPAETVFAKVAKLFLTVDVEAARFQTLCGFELTGAMTTNASDHMWNEAFPDLESTELNDMRAELRKSWKETVGC